MEPASLLIEISCLVINDGSWLDLKCSQQRKQVINQNTLSLLYAFFSVIPRRLNFICRRFGTLCMFHLHWLVGRKFLHTYPPMKMEQTESSETLVYKTQDKTLNGPTNFYQPHVIHAGV